MTIGHIIFCAKNEYIDGQFLAGGCGSQPRQVTDGADVIFTDTRLPWRINFGKCAEALNKFLRPKRGGKLFRLLRHVDALTDSRRQNPNKFTDTPLVKDSSVTNVAFVTLQDEHGALGKSTTPLS